jgi:hypothetical protein
LLLQDNTSCMDSSTDGNGSKGSSQCNELQDLDGTPPQLAVQAVPCHQAVRDSFVILAAAAAADVDYSS